MFLLNQMNNVLCLDIDDCIFTSSIGLLDGLDDSYEILEINLKRLGYLMTTYKLKIFITSAWYVRFKLVHGRLTSKYKSSDTIYALLDKYIGGNVIGLSSGDRAKDIDDLLDKGYQVIAIDDTDLSYILNPNYLFCLTDGLITNRTIYKISKFLKRDENERINK